MKTRVPLAVLSFAIAGAGARHAVALLAAPAPAPGLVQLHGTISNLLGSEPLSGVAVTAKWDGGESKPARSDPLGRYSLQIAAGTKVSVKYGGERYSIRVWETTSTNDTENNVDLISTVGFAGIQNWTALDHNVAALSKPQLEELWGFLGTSPVPAAAKVRLAMQVEKAAPELSFKFPSLGDLAKEDPKEVAALVKVIKEAVSSKNKIPSPAELDQLRIQIKSASTVAEAVGEATATKAPSDRTAIYHELDSAWGREAREHAEGLGDLHLAAERGDGPAINRINREMVERASRKG